MPTPAESAAKKLALLMESWRSIEVRYRIDAVNSDSSRPSNHAGTLNQTGRYIETAAGQRLSDDRITMDIAKGTSVQIEYDEGSRCASLLRTDVDGVPGREQVNIKRFFYTENDGRTCRPDALKYL